jgi:DNA-binding response OmpR family regulator
MACSDMQEAGQVAGCLAELNTGCLVTYLKAEDLLLNAPGGPVALIILATDDSSRVLRRTLSWLRHRWPACPITVVGDEGCGDYEMAAREGGATFLTRPVSPEHWSAIVLQAFRSVRQAEPQRPASRKCPAEDGSATG